MNPRLELLHPYPFERLRQLHAGLSAPADKKPINLGIGEPQHPTPRVITDALSENFSMLSKYPPTGGTPELRGAITRWIRVRYHIPELDPDRCVIPVAGTREALFALTSVVLDPASPGVVLLPNPFYQIYEGAALMAGARVEYVPTPREQGYKPDWSAVAKEVWGEVTLAYVCSPGNPSGAVLELQDWKLVFELADRYGFTIAADECYSEIYTGDPPIGALEAASRLGRGMERLIVFNSLSKRSSAAGLRSGFVAGDPAIIAKFLQYRAYHGAAPSSLTQIASAAAWSDETHVKESREKYQAKFALAADILPGVEIPEGGFFLWLRVGDDEEFSRRALVEEGLTVLPGRYLAREVHGKNPGANHVRVALVAEPDVCKVAMLRLKTLLDSEQA